MTEFISIERFLEDFVPAVIDNDAAVFAGAGLSRAAGFVDWKSLLLTFAEELGLDLDVETDLVAVAQYHLNREGRIRSRLNQKLTDELSATATPSEAHESLALLPLKTFWTSNYDSLIEDALRTDGRKVQIRKPGGSLTTSMRGASAEVLKMHGDISDPDKIVITRDDYERYARENTALLRRLQSDLLSKSFLFVGFSFADPNLELIFGELRQIVGDSPRTHYAIFKRPQRDEYKKIGRYRYELNRWQLRLQDLGRYGIQPVVVSDYDEIPEILRQIRIRGQRRRILVSGSFAVSEVWTERRLVDFCQSLGTRIVKEGFDLASGFGLGVGSPVISGAVEQLYRTGASSLERRLLLRPFPQTVPRGMTRETLWDQYRRDLIAPTGFAVFVAGNKLSDSGELVSANGVRSEFEIAREQGKFVLPVGASGSVAQELWSEVKANPGAFFPPKMPRRPLATLGSPRATNTEILDSLFVLVHWLTRS